MVEDKQIKKMNLRLQMISHFPEQIIKLWIVSQEKNQYILTKCLLNGNDNIKQIINMNIKFFIQKFKTYRFYNLWEIVDEIDEDTFEYILDNGFTFRIEYCKYVINNPKYVKKLLDKDYKNIIMFIDESVFFELVKDDRYKDILVNYFKDNSFYSNDNLKFLQSDRAFIFLVNELCKNGYGDLHVLEKLLILLIKVPDGYMTKEKVLAVSLNTGTYLLEYNENNYFKNLVKTYIGEKYLERIYRYAHYTQPIDYDRSEDIRKLIELGFIPSKSTILAHEKEYDVFIENNFFQVLGNDCIIDSRLNPSKRALLMAYQKGFDLSKIYLINDFLVKYSISKNEIDEKMCHFIIITFNNSALQNIISSREQINNYFDNDGPNQILYEIALFNPELFKTILQDDKYLKNYITKYNPSVKIINYINFIDKNGFVTEKIITTLEDIDNYFSDYGLRQPLYEKALFDEKLFKIVFHNDKYLDDYITRLNPDERIMKYIYLLKENGFILNELVKTNEDINYYFDNDGPKKELYDKALFNPKIFNVLFKKDEYYKYYIVKYNPSINVIQYITFVKSNEFILNNYINSPKDINIFFDEKGLTDFGIQKILLDVEIYDKLEKYYFKDYYEKNYNIPILNSILIKLNYNYSYFMDFINNSLNLPLPIKNEDEETIKKKYGLDAIDIDILVEIIKYSYFGPIDKNIICNIISSNKLPSCIQLYSIICSSTWDITTFLKFIFNYENNIDLCNNLINEKELSDKEKLKLQLILINGYKGAIGLINSREDLSRFNTLIFENNSNIINSDNIDEIRQIIFNFLFNINIDDVKKIHKKYNSSNGFANLKSSINNPKLKTILDEYDIILSFIFNIEQSDDLEGLKYLANVLNKLLKNDQLNILFELWETFSKFDSDIMTICGEEINEKIIDFDELLNTPENEIPIIENEKTFSVRDVFVPSTFEYDEEKISSGTNVKIIELNGLPFIVFGHVLNAFGSGGKLSDFNHPRVIGKTHLCLSAIGDNYYSLVTRDDSTIDRVQVLFTNLPSNSLVIASEKDVGSWTNNNSKDVQSNVLGNYLSIRNNISNTYHGNSGYNEYVYYREGSMPSGILIRGDMPTESEIQAAAYLSRICGKDIPLVKINKEKYPIRSNEEMKQRDRELEDYYRTSYEVRKKNQRTHDIEKLKQLRDYLLNLYAFNDSNGQLEGDYNDKRR